MLFWSFPTPALQQLMDFAINSNMSFARHHLETEKPTLASVTIDNSESLGSGIAKTAYRAILDVPIATSDGLGSTPREDVVTKAYWTETADNLPLKQPFDKEVPFLAGEANALVYAVALLRDATDAIEHARVEKPPPPSLIFPEKIRYVRCGMLMSKKEAKKNKTCLLVEERIPSGKWHKYVHNAQQAPHSSLDSEARDLAEYLCFVQHIQWWKTRGLAFISDFQGELNASFAEPHRS